MEGAPPAALRREAPHRLIFLDETGTTTKLTRLLGRARRGNRLKADAPFGHWVTQTFIAGLRCDGLIAPWVIDYPMNRKTFDTYVETQLIPALQPGDVVILDNLASHKSAKAQAILEQRRAAAGSLWISAAVAHIDEARFQECQMAHRDRGHEHPPWNVLRRSRLQLVQWNLTPSHRRP
jgi:hypothetical protein